MCDSQNNSISKQRKTFWTSKMDSLRNQMLFWDFWVIIMTSRLQLLGIFCLSVQLTENLARRLLKTLFLWTESSFYVYFSGGVKKQKYFTDDSIKISPSKRLLSAAPPGVWLQGAVSSYTLLGIHSPFMFGSTPQQQWPFLNRAVAYELFMRFLWRETFNASALGLSINCNYLKNHGFMQS